MRLQAAFGPVAAQDGAGGVPRPIEVTGTCAGTGPGMSLWLVVQTFNKRTGELNGTYALADLSGCVEGMVVTACQGEDSHAGQKVTNDPKLPGWTAKICLGGPGGVNQRFNLQLFGGPAANFAPLAAHFNGPNGQAALPPTAIPKLPPLNQRSIIRDR